MIDKNESKRINGELKAITARLKETYGVMRKQSEEKYKAALRPGETFRQQDGFYTAEDRAQFSAVCVEAKTKMMDIINGASKKLYEDYTKAPSTEAVNMLALITARKHVTADEIDMLMTRYGIDCPMVYNALLDKAKALEYFDFLPHPISKQISAIEPLERDINRLTDTDRVEGGYTLSAINVEIDQAFPVESESGL